MLRILGELNDTEVIWLRFYAVLTIGGDKEFREQHKKILDRPPAYIGSPPETHDKLALQESYQAHLAQLNLLSPRYRKDIQTRQPEFSTFTGAPELQGYDITGLGSLLLRHIGIHPEQNNQDEQGGADQSATAPESKPEGDSEPQPESEGRSQ